MDLMQNGRVLLLSSEILNLIDDLTLVAYSSRSCEILLNGMSGIQLNITGCWWHHVSRYIN